MKKILWLWLALFILSVVPLGSLSRWLDRWGATLMLVGGFLCLVGVIVIFVEITVRGLGSRPPET